MRAEAEKLAKLDVGSPILSIYELQSTNTKSQWWHACDADDSNRYVIVTTVN